MSLPTLVVFSLKIAENEVRYLSISGPQRQLRFGFDEGVYSDNARFTVEQAGNGLVHIRSCYENCYWSRASRFEPWLLASAPEAVEDMTNDMCTLFRPRMSAGNVSVGFVHVQSGLNVVMRPAEDAHAFNLCVERTASTEFSFVDYAPLSKKKLPRYIMFLGDNDKYMSAVTIIGETGKKYMRSAVPGQEAFVYIGFPTDKPTEKAVVFEVVYTKNGDIQLKSILYDEFFEVLDVLLHMPILNLTSDPHIHVYLNTVFEAVSSSPPNTSEVGIALLNRGFDEFCYRLHLVDEVMLYIIGKPTPHDRSAWLRPRHSETCRVNIESFRHAWAAPQFTRFLIRRSYTSVRDTVYEVDLNQPYQENIRTTFSNGITYTRGPRAVFNGRMPFVTTTGKLEFSDSDTDTNSRWGFTNLTRLSKEYVTKVTLQPMGMTYVTLLRKVATYEVPFSYQQFDDFPYGGTVTQHLSDGVLTLDSEYGVEMTTEFQPFDNAQRDAQQGVELEGEPGIFVHEVSDAQDSSADEFDQEADAIGRINLDASSPVTQEN